MSLFHTPYNSTSPIIRGKSSRKARFVEMMDEKLPFTTPTNVVSTQCIDNMIDTKLWKTIADEEKIIAFLPRKLTKLYLYTQIGAFFYLLFLLPFLIFCNLLIICIGSGSFWVEFQQTILLTYAIFAAAFIALILYTIIILDTCNIIKLPQSGFNQYFELNRKHGTATRFHKNKPLYTTPFTDFDCHLRPSMTHCAITYYSLHLVNLTIQNAKEIELSRLFIGDCSFEENYYSLWNTIQWYMDVSRPLPDLPILEEHRSKDPVTAAHDKEVGRKADFWASMAEEEFDNYVSQIKAKQKDLTSLGTPLQIQYVENRNAA